MIIKCRFVPKDFCVNLFGTLWVKDPSWIDRHVVNHERIHTAQQRELLWIPFYLFYFVEWIIRLLIERNVNRAYMNLSFEREAYAHGHDLNYLSRRKHYAWLKLLFKSK